MDLDISRGMNGQSVASAQISFIEAQIHGGVSLEDVKEIVIDKKLLRSKKVKPYVEEIEALAAEKGISIRYGEYVDWQKLQTL